MSAFVDEVRVHVRAGAGGNGCASFRREKFRPRGGPDGGNGGEGGSVLLRVDPNVATLSDLARHPHQRAERGANGSGNNRHGARGTDRTVSVPDGTMVFDEEGAALADLVGAGAEFVAAAGGRGGRGNAALASPRRRAPTFAERGDPGEERSLRLELRVLADVGLVGFPNAGKSSLIAQLSAARPKVAAYPFTTLTPNLGVAEAAGVRFVVADVPGLVEGAHAGRGLGHTFLRHLERCGILCFVLDLAGGAPGETLAALRAELRAYRPGFDERPTVVAGNKVDTSAGRDALAEAAAAARDTPFVSVSALTGEGVDVLADALGRAVEQARASRPPPHTLIRIRPEDEAVGVVAEEGGWRVRSTRVERLVRRADLDNAEAIAWLHERLEALGVDDALSAAGAQAGDEVRVGADTFTFEPSSQPARRRGGPR